MVPTPPPSNISDFWHPLGKNTSPTPPTQAQRTQRQPDSAPGLLDNCSIRTQRRITHIMYSLARRQNTVNTTTYTESRAFCQYFTVDKYTRLDEIKFGAIKKRLKRNARIWHNSASKQNKSPTIKTSPTSGTAGSQSGTICHQHQPATFS